MHGCNFDLDQSDFFLPFFRERLKNLVPMKINPMKKILKKMTKIQILVVPHPYLHLSLQIDMNVNMVGGFQDHEILTHMENWVA